MCCSWAEIAEKKQSIPRSQFQSAHSLTVGARKWVRVVAEYLVLGLTATGRTKQHKRQHAHAT